MWYLALLPLVVGRLRPGRRARRSTHGGGLNAGHETGGDENGGGGRATVCAAAWALGSWLGCLLFWLATAYRLEFLGHGAWTALWGASLAFYAASVACVAVVVRVFDDGSSTEEAAAGGAVSAHAPASTARNIKCAKKGN